MNMDWLTDFRQEFERHKHLIDKALMPLDDEGFFYRPGEAVNPVALIVKHLAGNLRSRWRDFLSTDGEKPDRDRDGEFSLTEADSRAALMAAWEDAWTILRDTLDSLTIDDLDRTVTIRGEPHTVRQALIRGLTHLAYHTGQILYVARWRCPDAPWQTIAPGRSREHRGAYRTGSRPATEGP